MRKKLTFLLIAILASLGAMASPPHQDEGNVAKWNNTEYATLQAAFDAAEAANPEDIVIDLLADASLDIAAWSGEKNSLSVGTATTKSITINGNNHKLDFVLKDSDWDNFATMNDAQTKLILNDLIITNSGYNTDHWKRRGVFFHCAVELNNVTAQCGIGFKNNGTINNVTINTGTSVYPIWVQADGPTEINIDGLTVNGERGIKISDEDAAKEKVILNIKNSSFTTSKKAAILVATNYGAEINDLGGNDLSKVAADSQNLVWIDEAPAYSGSINDIIVTGATKVLEGAVAKIGDTFYKTLAAAEAAASAGDKIEIFQPGTYKLPNISKNVTIEGIVGGVVFDHTGSGNIASVPNGATFKNMTFNFGNNDYHGFQHAGTINMEGCTLNGKLFSYGAMNFTNCAFNQTNSDYHMWCYDGDLTYSNCIFTNEATGKFLNVYNEGNGEHKVTVTGCKFVNEGSVNKAALNVKATCKSKLLTYDVYITESTFVGEFPAASISSPLVVLNELVQVDDRTADGVDNIRVWKDGVQIYPLNYVAQYNGKKYVSLQAALDAAKDVDDLNIVIDLLDDVNLYIDAWDGTKNKSSIGTVNTQSITINGNNHKLDFVNKNSDWNNVATMNDAQTKLILNDMTITNSGYNNGPWNRHDISFNCAVELNNVTSDKALAFKNSATLKKVTITETRVVKDGDYCIWISPRVENQTVTIDGLTATATNTNKNGRGIKVDDQYVDNPPKVTLNIANSKFATDKKAAILLKSAGGVDVIDGGNNNIDNVAADNVNLVWVDEAKAEEYYKYSLNSSGATMVPESKESDYVARLSDAEGKILGYYKGTNAIANAVGKADTGYTVTIFKAGSYTMPGLPKNITVEAAENVDGVVFNHTGSGNIAEVPNGATFKNLTFNFGNNNYHGFQHAGTINMEGCTLNGKLFSYGAMNFTKCLFNQSAEIAPDGDYNMWTYGVNDVKYTECTFKNTKTGKFLNVYREGDGQSKVYVDKCKFINEGSVNKAALNVKATCKSTLLTYDVYITESTTEGAFPAASISSELVVLNKLVQVDDRTADGVDKIQVWKDDVQIYPGIVKVTETDGTISLYPSLQEAVDKAGENAVVTPLIDIDLAASSVVITKPLTIDGENHAISSTAAQAILLKSTTEGNVKIQNVNITASKGHGIQIGDDNTANIAKLELENVILTTAKRGVRVYKEGTGFGIAIANSTIQSTKADPKTTYTTGNEAIALSLGATDGKGYEVTIENTVLQGYSYLINNVTSGSNINVTMTGGATYGRAAVNVWGKNNTFTLDGVEVHGLNNQTGPTEAFSCIVENIGAENNEFTIKDTKFIATLSEAAATTEGSSATEQMIDFRGSGSTAKILGETTYECNYPERGGLIYNEGALENNKMYFDDATKATFANAFTEAVISDEKEQPINLYPVNFTSEIYYYWFANGVEAGGNYSLIQPYANGWLSDGEFIRVKKDITLKSNIETKLASGTSYTLTFGEYNISKGDYSITMKEGVTVYTDKQTDIFSSATEGCDVYELTTETGYAYVCGNYVAKVNNKLYNSFSEAVTAAAGTKVIVLLKDIADTYAMTQGETLKVQKDGKAFNDPTAPADFTLKTLIDGAVTIYSVKANENLASISEGYYHIKNLGNEKYVNVKGRRTATVDATADDASTAAGTIIKVKANAKGQVEVLRSQAIDIPHYADRAMSYVHDFAKILVEKLNASGSGEILGTTGYEAIMKKFDDNFDHHLYVEQAQDGYRIFGRTPSMKPVVEFYQENKAKVDAKLPMLEQKINDAIAKVVDKVGKGYSFKDSFKLHTIWQRMNNSALTEPNDDATKLAFLQEVLSSEINVWNFAYESATFYMEKVEGSQYFKQIPAEIRNYWNLAKQVHPDFKYYIVQKDGKMDFISEGNTDIIHNDPRTVWALEQVDKMTVSVPEENSRVVGATFDEAGKRTGFETAYYTTLYTDFGYQLPEGVTALKVTKIKDTYLVKQKPENKLTYESDGVTLGLGLLETKEIGQDVPAQTPVLIMSKSAEPFQITIGDSYGASADVTDNLLHGADWLINEYKINTPALESLFALVEGKVSESITDKYEHLLRRNSGTVNNKYFFPISVKEDLAPAYKNKTGYKMQISPVLVLGKKEGKKLAFNETKDVIQANSVFLFSEENKPALFTLTGDVTRDGIIDVEDVTGQVNIVQKRDKKDYKYDYDAADVVVGETYYVDVDDVTRVLNIIQKRTDHPDLP